MFLITLLGTITQKKNINKYIEGCTKICMVLMTAKPHGWHWHQDTMNILTLRQKT